MSEKKQRQMSPKGFLSKTTTKAAANSAWGFLQQYRDYMTKGDLAPKLSPILNKLDEQRAVALKQLKDTESLAKTALKEIQNAVMTHIIEADQRKMEQKQEEAQTFSKGTRKPWIATILDSAGNIATRIKEDGEEEELVKGFDLSSDADRWCVRRLVDGAPDWYAEINHASLNIHTVMTRADAIAVFFTKKKGPTIHERGKSTKTLGFQHKAKENRFYFSRG